jgi:arylsulfatase A-like enzyme
MNITKESIAISLLIPSLSGCTIKQNNRPTDHPNIIMIVVDDLNDWIGPYGRNPQMLTPHMDKLAGQSVVFRNTSCPAPVSGPSRSAMLSGFLPSRTGVYGNGHNLLDSKLVQENATLPEYLSKNGYVTISKGKIFHKHGSENGIDHGQWAFDIWELEDGSQEPIKEKLFSRNKGIINGKEIPDAKYKDTSGSEFAWGPTIARKEETKDYRTAIWFADKLKQDFNKPFFMAIGIGKPHLPWFVPQEYFDKYALDTLKIPEHKLDDLDDIISKTGEKYADPSRDFLWLNQDEQLFKQAVRAYMAASTYADDCVGVVLNALNESKYADNTIIILLGDHGWHLAEKLRFRKGELWRESTQTTFLVHTPGMNSKQECFKNVNLIDIYPTLVDLCNLPKRPMIDGESLRPLLTNPQTKWHPAHTTAGKGNNSIISEDWHYIYRQSKGGVEEFYDLKKDPKEWTNLALSESEEILSAKKHLQSFMPEIEVDPLPARGRISIVDDGDDLGDRRVDNTLKKRDLNILK